MWEGGRGHRPRLGILSSRGVPGLPAAGEPRRQGSPHSLPPSLPQQDRPAGIPLRAVIAPTRREMPTFRSLQNQAVGSCPEKRDEARGLDTLPAPGPCTFPSSLLSPGLSRRDGPPCRAPHRPTVAVPGPQPPARLSHLGSRPRWWQWSSRSPSRLRPGKLLSGAGSRRSWGRRRRRRVARLEREAGEGRVGPGTHGDRPLPPQTRGYLGRAKQGGAGRKPLGTPRPCPTSPRPPSSAPGFWTLPDPTRPTRHLGNRGAGQSAAF